MKKVSLLFALLTCVFSNAQVKIYTSGKTAFGSTSSSPNHMVDVKSGDINVNDATSTNGYRLGQTMVLWQNNVGTSIFAGPDAGHGNVAKHNSAFGYQSLYSTNSSTTTPVNAFGYKALYSNTSGFFDDAFGDSALFANTSGTGNAAFGAWALTANTSGSNNACFGGKAMISNTTGSGNSAFGWAALNKNTTAAQNSAFGYEALINATTGSANTAFGYLTLSSNSTGSNNVAVGNSAGASNTTGHDNTFVGYGADMTGAFTYTNCAAYGSGALTNANNKIVIGNTAVTTIGGYAAWTNYSDGRYKTNVQEDVKGLSFIKKLRPVTYKINAQAIDNHLTQGLSDSAKIIHSQSVSSFTEASNIIHSGFIAQEVEQAAQSVGYNSSIVQAPTSQDGLYSMSYGEIVVPLVKAVQELNATIDSLKQQLNACCAATGQRGLNNLNTDPSNNGIINPGTSVVSGMAKLWQNTPNPFNQTTVIKCFIPDASKIGNILIFDLTGALKKTVPVSGKGEVNVTINAKELVAGMYNYSLIIDGQEIDTKKMILTE